MKCIDGYYIDYLDMILSKLGIKTCRNVFYESYATRLIPVRNGKGVRAPPSVLSELIGPLIVYLLNTFKPIIYFICLEPYKLPPLPFINNGFQH